MITNCHFCNNSYKYNEYYMYYYCNNCNISYWKILGIIELYSFSYQNNDVLVEYIIQNNQLQFNIENIKGFNFFTFNLNKKHSLEKLRQMSHKIITHKTFV